MLLFDNKMPVFSFSLDNNPDKLSVTIQGEEELSSEDLLLKRTLNIIIPAQAKNKKKRLLLPTLITIKH